jgi:catechol 2,3-dioxygenase-like lactoylglutathione lyase family enzyme
MTNGTNGNSEIRFKRTNLVVADLERALRVYRDCLGLTVENIKDSESDSYSYPVFEIPRKAKIRFATLDAPDQKRTMALTEITGIDLPPTPLPRLTASVIQVDKFDNVVARLKDEGLKTYPEEVLKGADGAPKGRELGFIDHDGHLTVIYRLNDA